MGEHKMNARQRALDFVEDLALPVIASGTRGQLSRENVDDLLSAHSNSEPQSLVAGASVISFASGVPTEIRQDIVNSSLLAQLAANKRTVGRQNVSEWYNAYFDVLTNVGWVMQERTFQRYMESGDDFEADQAILAIAAQVFGPVTSAVAIVKSTLDALKQASSGKWITVFNRESQVAHTAKFQLMFVEATPNRDVSISMMAFELKASASLTQVLFFKFRSNNVIFDHASGTVSMNRDVLDAVREPVTQKIKAYVRDFISNIEV